MSQGYRKKSLGTNVANTQVSDERDWQSALLRMSGAYSANTIRSYRADFTIFEAWCEQEKQQHLPAAPETVAEFVIADGKKSAPATVSRRRASIAKIHKLLKLENPVSSEDVNLATRTMYRQRGRRQDQALGLTAPLRQNLIDTCSDDLRGQRDRALISAGYDTLCRRAELVQLRIEDLKVRTDGSGTILVRKSKADQLGRGRLAYLSIDTVGYLQSWTEAAQMDQGPIFRGIQGPAVSSEAMHSSRVAVILKDRAKRAGLASNIVSQLSGHSMRVGAAQDMAAAGIDLGAIMHAGGWKSPDMVMRYIEHMDVQKSGMARLYHARR
jgi:site-specific recombinase XerD